MHDSIEHEGQQYRRRRILSSRHHTRRNLPLHAPGKRENAASGRHAPPRGDFWAEPFGSNNGVEARVYPAFGVTGPIAMAPPQFSEVSDDCRPRRQIFVLHLVVTPNCPDAIRALRQLRKIAPAAIFAALYQHPAACEGGRARGASRGRPMTSPTNEWTLDYSTTLRKLESSPPSARTAGA